MKNKKSQIQIGETVAVIFVFFILIIIGFVFYARFMKSSIQSEKEELSQLSSIGIAQRIMAMPEMQCSEDIIKEISNCIYLFKLESAETVVNDEDNQVHYFDLLGFSDIAIKPVYPEASNPNGLLNTLKSSYNPYSNPLLEAGKLKGDKITTNVPVSLYNPVTRKHGFGIMTIETYFKP